MMFGFGKNKLKSTDEFYTQCVKGFHKTAKQQGYAKHGPISVTELMPYGEKTVSAYLDDNYLLTQFGNDPAQYYFVVMSMCLQCGIVYADKWHENPEILKNGYDEQIIAEGPSDAVNMLLLKKFGLDAENANLFYSSIFAKWVELQAPYWELEDPGDYTFKAMLAAYQLGISMLADKIGS